MTKMSSLTLGQAVDIALENYFNNLNGEIPTSLHNMVIFEVEKSLFGHVMEITSGNQSEASKILGINRNTLRTRLRKFDML